MDDQVLQEKDYSGRLDWGLWVRVLRRALTYRRELLALSAVAVTLAGIEAAFPLVVRAVVDGVLTEKAAFRIWPPACAYMGLVAALASCVWFFIVLAGKITSHVSHDVRRAGFAKLQELSFSYFDRRPAGWLISRLTSDCERLADFIAWGLLDLVWCLTLMAGIAVVMLVLHWKLALITLSVIPVLIGACWYFHALLLDSARVIRKQNSLITASYNEGLQAVRTTKALVRETENLGEFRQLSTTMFDAAVRNALHGSLFWPVVLLLASFGTGLALWRGGVEALAGAISLGTLVAFISYTRSFFDPVHQLAHVVTQAQRAQASAERILDLLETEPDISDAPAVAAAIARRRREAPADRLAEDGLSARIGQVEFRDVSFAYRGGKPVLERFSLIVHAGQTIALVGPTGGGKTTIVSLLCRFYEPSAGEVLLDGVEYRRRGLHWLQSNLGIVLQTPHLFTGSVKENIRYGRLEASDEEVIAAAKLARAHGFIEKMPQGYDSSVGLAGNALSTGQKQLVSLARAVLTNPQILVLDEATSSVDTETERLIQEGVEAVLSGRLSFVIAHRLSTIRHADLILMIDHGRIVERGNHHELLAQRGAYYDLYTKQFVQEKEDEIFARPELGEARLAAQPADD